MFSTLIESDETKVSTPVKEYVLDNLYSLKISETKIISYTNYSVPIVNLSNYNLSNQERQKVKI